MTAQPFLVAEQVSCVVAERSLFRSLDVVAAAGDLVEIRGPNGSGKSTLLRGLAGLHELRPGRLQHTADFEYLSHRAGLGERLTPLENMRWLLRMRRRRVGASAIDAAMIRVGLGEVADDLCATLSAGQQRRAALARLVVSDAPLWLLDEPLTALDHAGIDLVRQLIAEHRGAGGAVVCATHTSIGTGSRTERESHEIVLGQ